MRQEFAEIVTEDLDEAGIDGRPEQAAEIALLICRSLREYFNRHEPEATQSLESLAVTAGDLEMLTEADEEANWVPPEP
jgi:hypothetical protein